MIVNEFDTNSNGDYHTGILLRKKHFEEYFKMKVYMINMSNIRSFQDLKNLLTEQ